MTNKYMNDSQNKIDIATQIVTQKLQKMYGVTGYKNLQIEHTDNSGYWFVFEFYCSNKWQLQKYAVRHYEI